MIDGFQNACMMNMILSARILLIKVMIPKLE